MNISVHLMLTHADLVASDMELILLSRSHVSSISIPKLLKNVKLYYRMKLWKCTVHCHWRFQKIDIQGYISLLLQRTVCTVLKFYLQLKWSLLHSQFYEYMLNLFSSLFYLLIFQMKTRFFQEIFCLIIKNCFLLLVIIDVCLRTLSYSPGSLDGQVKLNVSKTVGRGALLTQQCLKNTNH